MFKLFKIDFIFTFKGHVYKNKSVLTREKKVTAVKM